jgi:3-keto-disaccharide hydrolase
MRTLFSVLLLATSALWVHAEDAGKTALDRDPKGWLDLFPGKDLKGWKRVPIAPDTTLNAKNPWKVKGKVLVCDGVGMKEMLLTEKQFTDGIFHVEWRFRKLEGKKDYNSGIYVRTLDGKVWVQVQVAHVEKPPFLGDVFGDVPVKGKVDRVIVQGDGKKHAHPPGEWNTYEITMKGKTISVQVNGKPAVTWKDCPLTAGHVGMQDEFYYIEFRNLKFKPLK